MTSFLSRPRIYWFSVFLLLGLWMVMAFRLRFPAYLSGQIPMLDFDSYHTNLAAVVRTGAHPFSFSGLQTLGPPSVLIPYVPFAFLPLQTARGLITIINIICIWLTAWFLARSRFKTHQVFVTTLLAVVLTWAFPVRFTLEMGQTNLIIMLLVTLMLTKAQHKGLFAGIMVILKTNYLPVLISLLKTKRFLFQALAAITILIFSGLIWIRPGFYQDYFKEKFFAVIADSGQPASIDYYNQSFKATLARFQLSPTYQPLAVLLIIVSSIYLAVTGSLASAVLFSILISPVAWVHYMAVIYPIILLHLLRRPRNWKVTLPMSVIILLLSNHLTYLHDQPVTPINSLLASHYFFGLVFLTIFQLVYEYRLKKRISK